MPLPKKAFGKQGERYATRYLQDRQYSILSTNYRCRIGEIDIIARKNKTIYFIEVKTRWDTRHGKPYEAVDFRKLHQLRRTAQYFLLQNHYLDYKLSIGVVSLVMENGAVKELLFFDNVDV